MASAAVAATLAFSWAAAGRASADGVCSPDALQATCGVLDNCYVLGAIRMTAAPEDAVAYYRTCLFTDHRFALVAQAGAGARAVARSQPLPRIYDSTFWPLYCLALERAGRTDRSICERRAQEGRTLRAHRHHRRHSARRRPSFTG